MDIKRIYKYGFYINKSKILYAKNLKLKLFFQLPKIIKTVYKEQQLIDAFIKEDKEVVGIISDNRFGVRSTIVPSIYITSN